MYQLKEKDLECRRRDNEKSDTKQQCNGEIQESSTGDSGKLRISGINKKDGRFDWFRKYAKEFFGIPETVMAV